MLEALVVAIAFLLLFFMVRMLFVAAFKSSAVTTGMLATQVAITAGLFHVVCEYTRVNAWYCRHR